MQNTVKAAGSVGGIISCGGICMLDYLTAAMQRDAAECRGEGATAGSVSMIERLICKTNPSQWSRQRDEVMARCTELICAWCGPPTNMDCNPTPWP